MSLEQQVKEIMHDNCFASVECFREENESKLARTIILLAKAIDKLSSASIDT